MQRILEPEVMDTAQDAAEYDAMDHTAPNTAFVARLVQLGARGRMLDLGTGPGHIPLLICAAIPDCTILGVDLSEEMLAIARRRAAASPFHARIEYQAADVKSLPFPDRAFDTVCSNTILHHIADPLPFLVEARRVLKPGGAFLIRDLFRPPDAATLDHLVALHAADADPHQRALFRDSLRAALSIQELEQLVHELGWPDVRVVVDTDRHASIQRPARGGR